MDLSPHAIAEVRITLDSFFEAYSRGDLDEIMGYYLDDERIIGMGTGADERNLGWEEHKAQIERDLSQSSSRQVTIEWFKGAGQGDVAWAATEGPASAVTEAGEFTATLRMSFVLVRTEGGWKIVLGHGSVPLAGQEAGQSFPGE
ncbi:MAG: nuclear transport factor 2 family protein [Desulfarculus sp.]|nr:nuclear transport factor 2 family protein [Pseudomonadota bacterium]MBV1716738.1 nuclear transport factor 2 family protein [Desulfarculus sp.]MBU4573394.1 nuclear transport factor 2 family protein [Pseudomonadota bacterium]MBU4596514.1 nuclear transport factor 2 family protein [Pseudomonadota bacterium]MBV1738985.1 nuclear transport factor 2 family protein [Desulfarculus sp.]